VGGSLVQFVVSPELLLRPRVLSDGCSSVSALLGELLLNLSRFLDRLIRIRVHHTRSFEHLPQFPSFTVHPVELAGWRKSLGVREFGFTQVITHEGAHGQSWTCSRVGWVRIGRLGDFTQRCQDSVLLDVHAIGLDNLSIPHNGTKSRCGSCGGSCSYDGCGRYGYDPLGRFDEPDHGMPQTISGYHTHPEATRWPLSTCYDPHRRCSFSDTLILSA